MTRLNINKFPLKMDTVYILTLQFGDQLSNRVYATEEDVYNGALNYLYEILRDNENLHYRVDTGFHQSAPGGRMVTGHRIESHDELMNRIDRILLNKARTSGEKFSLISQIARASGRESGVDIHIPIIDRMPLSYEDLVYPSE